MAEDIVIRVPGAEPPPPPPAPLDTAPVLTLARDVGSMEEQLNQLRGEVAELRNRPPVVEIIETPVVEPVVEPVEDEEEDEGVVEVEVPSLTPIAPTEPATVLPEPRKERGPLARLFLGSLPPT